ncbi:hypothetical protein BT96DRAFT_572810 [Gymnopus androsaceus JB14]|uniref:F-box domain-containing protein n=1 Tax=Gymnopus androsaceus JB14 TaxID=1447944 RepID=A0A6A4HYA5_9AGAR|nr:hypothetical protein BT96DRAFT_572810 [Gymnopus androsaceus JB14]
MPVSTDLTRFITPFLKKIIPHNDSCFIQNIPLDVWVDKITTYLTIEDVICLRRVNKMLFLITHEPIIWKRFLVRLSIPIPPLRPSLRWSWDSHSFQIEQLVAKAICTDDNWRRLSPKLSHTRVIFAFNEVLEMKLLPGGQYMVASVKDSSSRRFYICIFCLDHPEPNYPPLARLPVPSKAFNLEARFLPHEGRQGITIMYSQRSPEDGHLRGYDLSEWSARPDLDSPYPLRHDCICTFVDMEALELLSDPSVNRMSRTFRERAAALPKPFQLMIHFVSNAPVEHSSLFEADGKPFAALVQKPNEIVIMDLTSNQLSSIKCLRIDDFNAAEHKIRAIRVLPKQNQVLVVRTIRLRKLDEKQDQHLVELYTLPNAGELGVESQPDQYILITNRNAHSIHLSDNYDPPRGIDHPFLHDPNARPPPLSIYVCGEQLEGTEHINIDPELSFDGRWVYNLEWLHEQTTIHDAQYGLRVIPGVRRALVYTVPLDDRSDNPKIRSLSRYFNPNFHLEDYPHGAEPEGDLSVLRKRYLRPAEEYTAFKFNSTMFKTIAETGFSAIAWDESTGRICIATQKTMKFLIMDVKMIVPPDDRFAQWRKLQSMMNDEA